MTTETTAPAGNGHALGRRPKSTQDDIIPIAWRLFEENGYEATTMSDIAAAVGISRRTLFNYFPTKEALLYPAVDEYMDEFTRLLLDRPADEPLFASLKHCLYHCRDKQLKLEAVFNPGPAVHAARLTDGAVRFSRDHWAREMEHAVLARVGSQPDGSALAGFVGALAAQVWTEMTKHMKAAGPDADFDSALTTVMGSLQQLFA